MEDVVGGGVDGSGGMEAAPMIRGASAAIRSRYRTSRPAIAKSLTSRPVVGAVVSRTQGNRFLAKLNEQCAVAGSWTIALGWSTWVSSEPTDADPIATLQRCGEKIPDALFLDGVRIESATTSWTDIERIRARYSPRTLVAAPFHESIHVGQQAPLPDSIDDYRRFRLLPAMRFTNPALTLADPRRLREHQLLRWTDPGFFFEQTQFFQESAVGWGGQGVAGIQPTVNTYQCLYYTSLIAREIGPEAARPVIEIGGGFGNFARVSSLSRPELFSSHTLIDLPPMLRLQRWFLDEEFPGQTGDIGGGGASRFRFSNVESVASWEGEIDVVVATHSLSELDPAQVNSYVDNLLLPSSVVLLVLQRRLFGTPITYDWVIRRMLDAGFVCRRVDALAGRNTLAVLLARSAET
jgi:hypothetical protein